MKRSLFQRSVEELELVASKFWPRELSQLEAELSVIPKLLETQDEFISILSVAVAEIEGVFQIVDASTLSGRLFLKHLIVLADFGGENLKRVSNEHRNLFAENSLTYIWSGKTTARQHTYTFKSFPTKKLSNDALRLGDKQLLHKENLTDLQKDAIAILLFGASSINEKAANVLATCEVGGFLGQPERLERFIRQRYIWVSRITKGSQSNRLGQLAQEFVRAYLEDNLNVSGVELFSNGHIPNIRHAGEDDARLTTFDLVANLGDKYVAIEISFQVTTNSVIERKAGQAQARFEQLEAKRYKIAYVLDGAGNFERVSALRTLCSFSHCTVAFSGLELGVLCEFVRQYFSGGL